jgi:hypothetical protein
MMKNWNWQGKKAVVVLQGLHKIEQQLALGKDRMAPFNRLIFFKVQIFLLKELKIKVSAN